MGLDFLSTLVSIPPSLSPCFLADLFRIWFSSEHCMLSYPNCEGFRSYPCYTVLCCAYCRVAQTLLFCRCLSISHLNSFPVVLPFSLTRSLTFPSILSLFLSFFPYLLFGNIAQQDTTRNDRTTSGIIPPPCPYLIIFPVGPSLCSFLHFLIIFHNPDPSCSLFSFFFLAAHRLT